MTVPQTPKEINVEPGDVLEQNVLPSPPARGDTLMDRLSEISQDSQSDVPDFSQVSHRRTSHFFMFLIAEAILTVLLAGGAFAVLQSHRPVIQNSNFLTSQDRTLLENSGALKLTAPSLIKHVNLPFHHGTQYWLGPKDGYSYTTDCMIPGELTVTYMAPGQSVQDLAAVHLIVTVYENESFYAAHIQSLAISNPQSVINNRGDILTFNGADPRVLKISQQGSSQVILITYPSPQSLTSLITDSQNVRALPSATEVTSLN